MHLLGINKHTVGDILVQEDAIGTNTRPFHGKSYIQLLIFVYYDNALLHRAFGEDDEQTNSDSSSILQKLTVF